MLREVRSEKESGSGWVRLLKGGRTYGVPNPVWLLLGGACFLFASSRIFSGSSITDYSSHTSLDSRALFNASLAEQAPFDFCPVFGPNDTIAERRGQWGLLRSRLHTGSGARIQRVVQKALAGEATTISILGGSVSACHGAGDDPVATKCYPHKFFSWWNEVFPHPNSELTNGAARKHDSAYYAYCSMHHLPDHTDLVILEFDTSDPNDAEWLSHFELLVRSILVRPDAPAVIILGHFAPQIQAQNGFAGPELLHTVVAQFYDVPHISLKGVLYHDYMASPEEWRSKFYADPMLSNPDGHDLIADLLISYMQGQICSGWAATMGHGFDVPYMAASAGDEDFDHPRAVAPASGSGSGAAGEAGSGSGADGEGTTGAGDIEGLTPDELAILEHKNRATRVPKAMLIDRPSDILKFREVKPYCAAANDLIDFINPRDLAKSGWKSYHPAKGADDREKHHWYSTTAGSRLRVPIELSAGDVTIYYLQQPEDIPAGSAACWVDDNINGATELSGNADVHGDTPTMTVIDEAVAPGSHYVECMILGPAGKETAPFKLLGVFGT